MHFDMRLEIINLNMTRLIWYSTETGSKYFQVLHYRRPNICAWRYEYATIRLIRCFTTEATKRYNMFFDSLFLPREKRKYLKIFRQEEWVKKHIVPFSSFSYDVSNEPYGCISAKSCTNVRSSTMKYV